MGESLKWVSLFLSTGFERGEKCVYVVDERTKGEVIDFMRRRDVKVEDYLRSGQLIFLTKEESYLKGDYFDPNEMIDLIKKTEGKALREGYNGLRITGEMTWVFSKLPRIEKLMEYEMMLNDFFPDSRTTGLCQYNEERFSPKVLVDVIYVHPKIILHDNLHNNPHYMPPDIFLNRLEGKVSWEHYERLKDEIIQRKVLKREREEALERKDFLNTLLRQDLRSRQQIIQGYHQLLEEADLPEEHLKYLRRAIRACRKADEVLSLANKLEDIERTEWTVEKDIVKILEHVIKDINSLAKEREVEIREDYPEKISKVKGDYSLNTLFKQLLSAMIRLSGCNKIKINASETGEDISLNIEDDGKPLPKDIKKELSGKTYTGETSGAGGVRYYMLREIARHNNAKIRVKPSELGGARFDIRLEKA